MYRISDVYDGLKGMIGWRSSFDSGVPTPSEANAASSSGSYYQDFSALVTLRNLYEGQNFADISDDQFNTLLEQLEKSAINKVVNAIFMDTDILDTRILYPNEDVLTNVLTNDISFVGFEIELYKMANVALRLNRIFTAFSQNDTIELLLFHSSQKDPIETKKSISTIGETNTVTILDWILSSHEYGGGKFYLGYLRSGLTAEAYNREYDSANVMNCYNFAKITPIKVSEWDAETLFDIEDIEYMSESWGLNLDATSSLDYTDFILSNKFRFVNAIGMQMAVDVLDILINTTRSNRIERSTSFDAKLEKEGNIRNQDTDIPKSVGILCKLNAEIKQLRKNLINQPTISKMTLG